MAHHPSDPLDDLEPEEPYYVVRATEILDGELYRVLCDGRPGYRSPPMTLECASREAERANGRVCDPGDYYDNKAANARVLREALEYARQAAQRADDAFSTELERCYGPKRMGDARYRYYHNDERCQRAAEAKKAADARWHGVREALERAEYVGD